MASAWPCYRRELAATAPCRSLYERFPYLPTMDDAGGLIATSMSGEGTEWVTVRGAAARLGMSTTWVRSLAADGVVIRNRGGRPGVN